MTNEIQQTYMTTETHLNTLGVRLKSTREAKGLSRNEAAAQLHLNEKFIIMMEEGNYTADLPATFIRGYLKAYTKLLELSEQEITEAIASLFDKPAKLMALSKPIPLRSTVPNRFMMRFFTYLVPAILVGLLGVWWQTHTNYTFPVIAQYSSHNTHEAKPALQVSTLSQTTQAIATKPVKTTEIPHPLLADNTRPPLPSPVQPASPETTPMEEGKSVRNDAIPDPHQPPANDSIHNDNNDDEATD